METNHHGDLNAKEENSYMGMYAAGDQNCPVSESYTDRLFRGLIQDGRIRTLRTFVLRERQQRIAMGNEISLNTTNGLSIEYRPEALNNGSGTGTVFGFGVDNDSGLSMKSYVGTYSSGGPSTEAAFRCNIDGEWSSEGTITSEDNESSGTVRATELWYLKGELSEKRNRVAGGVSGTESVDKAWAEIDHSFEDEGLTTRAGGYLGNNEAGGFLSGRLDNDLQMAVGGAVAKNRGTFGYGVGFQDSGVHVDFDGNRLVPAYGYMPKQKCWVPAISDDSDSDSD